MKAAHHKSRRVLLLATLSAATTTVIPFVARGQVGTGGTTAAGGAFAGTDMFLSVQKDDGVNLNDLNRARYLNRASCLCRRPAVVKAVVLPSASLRAAAVQASASVSMYIGNDCDLSTSRTCCHLMKTVEFSQFRANGLAVPTNVDDLARVWSLTSGNCADTRTDPVVGTGGTSGTGGVSGTGGSTGTGGTGGTGGSAGTSGTGGTGTGGTGTGGDGTGGASASGGSTGTVTGRCSLQFAQTLWVFVGTTGMGSADIATAKLGIPVDPEPPLAPAFADPGPANEALLLSWTGLSSADTSDLLGYQILCTRADATQVFKTGTFSAAFDSCVGPTTSEWPIPEDPNLSQASFACSSLLSPASTSYRLKILENDITYHVGVAAIDKQLNASVIVPRIGIPAETKDFYSVYRHGDPQGQATGGYCAISGDDSTSNRSMGLTAASLGGLVFLVAALGRWRRPRSRRRR